MVRLLGRNQLGRVHKVEIELAGGLAFYNVIRATQNIDLLTHSEKADDIDRELVGISYRRLHRSPDAGNY